MDSRIPTEQGQIIMTKMKRNEYDCSICMNTIQTYHNIWTCQNCYTSFHITCVTTWSEDKNTWNCPICMKYYSVPPKPTCFCGKQISGSKFDDPHCCGDICGKYRTNSSCPHPCTRKCHPGPCGQCTATGKAVKCFCGRNNVYLRCGEDESHKSCGNNCLKEMKCKHACMSVCHDGPCPKCMIEVERKCYCGKHSKTVVCGDVKIDKKTKGCYSCDEICGKVLKCGKHYCTKKCHSGSCEECPTPITITQCSCGKTKYNRKNCNDPFEECSTICGKIMSCGHKCQQKCHFGECVCPLTSRKPCRCGKEIHTVPCNFKGEIICKNVCGDTMNCKVHTCENICCSAHGSIKNEMHRCFKYCGKELECGHKCMELCHGNKKCNPCGHMLLTPLTCRCGETKIMPPIPCGTMPPVCYHPCKLPLPCGHESVKHNCHFGPCPRCTTRTEKTCFCGKEMVTVPCFISSASCGKVCGKPMACGIHFCKRTCHDGPCTTEDSCPYECGKEKEGCSHKCTLKCHGNTPCPITPCNQLIEISCACGYHHEMIPCNATPSEPYQPKQLECDEECEKEQLKHKKVELEVKEMKYPIWYMYLFHTFGKTAKQLEKSIIEFITSPTQTRLELNKINDLCYFLVKFMCEYYQIDITFEIIKKQKRIVLIKSRQTPKLCKPTASEIVGEFKQQFSLKGIDNGFIINVIVYTDEVEEVKTILHLGDISDIAYESIMKFINRNKYGFNHNQVDWKNILLFIQNEDIFEYCIQQLNKIPSIIIREKIVEEEIVPLIRNDEGEYTEYGVETINKMIFDRLKNKQMTYKIAFEMGCYVPIVLTNYQTRMNCLKESNEPLLKLENKSKQQYVMKEMFIEVEISKTQINKSIGYHSEIKTFNLDMYIGASESNRLKIEWNKDISENGETFHFYKTIHKNDEIQLVSRRQLFIWVNYQNKEVIGKKASVSFYIESRHVPVVGQKKKK